jgi:catechol 2,3-dioxygenase-like lactoylglutathione lyase family enzyme
MAMTRRTMLLSIPMIATASRMLAQSAKPALTVRALNHMTLTVSDRQRSLEFYQGLFGWPVQHNQGTSTGIRIGAGPQYVSLSQGGLTARPGINHFCLTIDDFDVTRIMRVLAAHGVSTTGGPGAGAMRAWVRMRGADAGGAKEGTPELYVNDPDGNRFQLQDPRYCGGAGLLGEVCPSLPAGQGRLAVRDYDSFTLSGSPTARSKDFYQALFALAASSQQESIATMSVGTRSQRLLVDTSAASAVAPRIAQASLVMDDLDPARAQKALAEFGVKPVADFREISKPLASHVLESSETKTTEVLFTDPDGILVRLRSRRA